MQQWAIATTARVNALFDGHSVLTSADLITRNGDFPSLGKLNQIRCRLSELTLSLENQAEELALAPLHPGIASRCLELYRRGNYDEAVFNALKAVESEIRRRIDAGPELIGVDLVSTALNAKSPRLIFSEVLAEQDGFHLLFRGAITLFKNPLSHRFLDISDKTRTLEVLTVASLLMKLLDEAKASVGA